MLRLMLDHHPDMSFPHEYDFAVQLIGDDGRFPVLDRYHAFLATNGVFRRSGFSVDPDLDFFQLQRSFLEQRRRGRPVVGGTAHLNFSKLTLLWTEARFIHLVRDPRAVACSVVQMGWAGNAWAGVQRWVSAQLEWERVCNQVTADRRMELRYEDLVRNPAQELGRVCSFIGVPFEPAMLEYPRDSTYDLPESEKLEAWRSKLSPREQALIEGSAEPWIDRFGYSRSGYRPVRPSPIERGWLRFSDRMGRVRFAIRRHGAALYLEHILAKLFGPESARRRIRARMQAINDRYIR